MPRVPDSRVPASRALLLALVALAAGCAKQTHLQYDHGRATMAATAAQANLARPSAADAAYALTGKEGIELRERATESTTDTESGEAEKTAKVQVQ